MIWFRVLPNTTNYQRGQKHGSWEELPVSYSKPSQKTSKMELFVTKVNDRKPLTVVTKSSILRCLTGFWIRYWLPRAKQYDTDKRIFLECILEFTKAESPLELLQVVLKYHCFTVFTNKIFWQSILANVAASQIITRSSRPEVFYKKGVLRNFVKFIGKHLYQGLFFNKVAGLRLLLFTIFVGILSKLQTSLPGNTATL